VTCPVLGSGAQAHTLPVVRIQAPQGAYDYQNKYFTDVVKYHCPSGLPAAEEDAGTVEDAGMERAVGTEE
jgi:D-alanine-D-alanine ligase